MAAVAVLAEASGVRVLAAMAGNAITGNSSTASERGRVAIAARNICMRAIQRKARLRVVIELPRLPERWIVARVALPAECAAMRVVVRVAGDAIAIGIMKRRGCMAAITRRLRVRAEQRKTREVVVEPHPADPVGCDMTIPALCTQLAVMRVFIAVAANAASRN